MASLKHTLDDDMSKPYNCDNSSCLKKEKNAVMSGFTLSSNHIFMQKSTYFKTEKSCDMCVNFAPYVVKEVDYGYHMSNTGSNKT